MDLEKYFKEKREIIDRALCDYLCDKDNPLADIMNYSVLSEGKRFRPILIITTVEALGKDYSIAIPAACAMELVHCFSLVHDDLPCMDNDDYRRGRLSCHKKFSEAQALLAGDALLARAFEIITDSDTSQDVDMLLKIIREFANATGAKGMIGGQFLECITQESEITEEILIKVHRYKTGALIRGSVRIGAIIGGAGNKDLKALTEYGESIGLLFQITDDIIDAKTEIEHMSFSSFYGIQKARFKAKEVAEAALCSLKKFSGRRDIFEKIVEFLLIRER